MSLIGIQSRSKTVQALREELQRRGFAEYIPQLLENSQPLEPTISLFKTAGHRFLSSSPEGYLKKAMSKGARNCFAFGHCFRDQEQENRFHKIIIIRK